jgi:hypothetical protein
MYLYTWICIYRIYIHIHTLTDKLVENLALTTPLDPWERVTLPQTTKKNDDDV